MEMEIRQERSLILPIQVHHHQAIVHHHQAIVHLLAEVALHLYVLSLVEVADSN